ncbi:MAG TPA: SGNH/GDSL hydrolase family protein [Planctomycetota bacterium]|nr:SGNH/GDSL hydrolase family protein [Planctomycetota bacterium]
MFTPTATTTTTCTSSLRLVLSITLALLAVACTQAADAAPSTFADGDRVAFIGDSITHGGFYAPNVMLFYATRYPERSITWSNCGISGDYTGGVLQRFDWDIAPHTPTVAVVMLGMNDVGRDLYGMPDPSKQIQDQRRWNLEGYAKNLAALTARLEELQTNVILVTPSIYDQTCAVGQKNYPGVDDALTTCSATVAAVAAKRGLPVVDFHAPMVALNAKQQAIDPSFTIIGADRVHPSGPGELVMAYLFLKAQGITPTVATIAIDAAQAKALTADNCTISDLSTSGGDLTFTVLEKSLPFPIFKHQQPALALIPFIEELDRETLRIAGLGAGRWKVSIDDKLVATCTGQELADGINLATNDRTPQYAQALRVADSNFKRQAIVAGKLRAIACVHHSRLVKAGVAIDDFAAAQKVLQSMLASEKNDYVRGLMQTYVDWKPKEAALKAEVAGLDATMLVDAKPIALRFHITAVH